MDQGQYIVLMANLITKINVAILQYKNQTWYWYINEIIPSQSSYIKAAAFYKNTSQDRIDHRVGIKYGNSSLDFMKIEKK